MQAVKIQNYKIPFARFLSAELRLKDPGLPWRRTEHRHDSALSCRPSSSAIAPTLKQSLSSCCLSFPPSCLSAMFWSAQSSIDSRLSLLRGEEKSIGYKLFLIQILLIFTRFELLQHFIFEFYRPQTWQFYSFFPALFISGIHKVSGLKFGGWIGHVTMSCKGPIR